MALRTPFVLRRWATLIPRPTPFQLLKPPVKLQWGSSQLLLQTPLGLFGTATSRAVRSYYGRKGTKPSNHERTAMELAIRKIKEVNVHHVPPRSFKNVWNDFQKELNVNNGTGEATSAEKALELLSVPLTTRYSSESEFDGALFEAFKECLKNQILSSNDKNTIILKERGDYAVGISRQKASAMNLLDARNLEKSHVSSTSSGLNVEASPDHSVCLFEKRDESWSVTDCFSIVELKMSDSNCMAFHVLNNDAYEVDLAEKHGALAQALMYNIGCIVLHRAKRGVLKDIPLVIIAGRRKRASGTSTRTPRETLRWVSGDLFIPLACGGHFYYGIKGFGEFHNSRKIERDRSVEQALSLYMEAMLFGLIDAIAVWNKLVVGDIPLSGPASGKSIVIGNMTLDLPLCASPIPGAVVAQDSNETTHAWKVSQGELFKGEIDLHDILENSGARLVSFSPENRKMLQRSNVLVKISSPTVHNLLIRPRDCYTVLEHVKGDAALAKEIGSVLYAVIAPKPGLITIMRDLTSQGYGSLEPMDHPGKLAILWGAFQELAETVLLPMANHWVIHSDIRPGYDFTANILCKITNDKGGIDKANMKLIDFDSFVDWDAWNEEKRVLDGRYVKCDVGWDPTTFVWWQCMAVAYSWKEKLTAKKLRTENGMGMLKKYLRGEVSGGPAWLEKYSALAKVGRQISSDELKSTLKDLATEF